MFEIPSKNLVDFSKEFHILKDLTESTIWIIFDDLFDYLLDLELYGLHHGDIRPEFIYITELRSVKVLAPLMYTTFKTGYQAMLNSEQY